MENSRWYVLQVLTNQEKKVAQHLQVRCHEYYLPVFRERSRWSDRSVTLERPLFAGYVFTRFNPESRFSVISTPGVLRLLGVNASDTVSDFEIERIREALAEGCVLRPHVGPAIGTHVRVRSGAFGGAEGVVIDLRGSCKVILSLAATRQCFSLEVDIADVEPLENPVGAELESVPQLV